MQPFIWKRFVGLRGYQLIMKLIQGALVIAVFVKFRISYEYMMYMIGVFLFLLTIKSDIILDIRSNSENLLVLPLQLKEMLRMKLMAYVICDYIIWAFYAEIYILVTMPMQSFEPIKLVIALLHFACFFISLYYVCFFVLALTWKKGKSCIINLIVEGLFISLIYCAILNNVLIAGYIIYTLIIRFFTLKILTSIDNEKLICDSIT